MANTILISATLAVLAAVPGAIALQVTPGCPVAQAAPAGLSSADRARLLSSAAQAMSDVRTAKGNFEQVAPDYSVTKGTFALKRPGFVRFDYADPTPLLIVSNGTTVAIQDSDLETTDRVPLSQTPLALLLDDQLDFETEAEVVDVRSGEDTYEISLADRAGEVAGQLTLQFTQTGNELVGWRTLDGSGNITQVKLSDIAYGARLNPRLFIMDDFEDEDD